MRSVIFGGIVVWLIAAILSIPAWITHVFYCFANEHWVMLLVGAIFAPLGVLHGFYIWFT